MSVRKLDHVYVEARDYERARAFWKALGFAVEAEWGEEGHRACRLVAGAAQVVLAGAARPVRPTVHLWVDEPEALAARLDGAGAVKVVRPLEDTHWGTRWIVVEDPDGNQYALEAARA